jgi:hypothetical protein
MKPHTILKTRTKFSKGDKSEAENASPKSRKRRTILKKYTKFSKGDKSGNLAHSVSTKI